MNIQGIPLRLSPFYRWRQLRDRKFGSALPLTIKQLDAEFNHLAFKVLLEKDANYIQISLQ